MPAPVVDAIKDHIDLEARIGGYEAADARADQIRDAYLSVGALVGAPAAKIAVTENATAAFIQALSSIPFQRGDTLVTTRNDYISNQIMYLSLESRLGVEVIRAPDSEDGGVDVAALAGLVHRKRPRLVAVTHIPTNSGLVQDVAAVGRICREQDTLFLLDACQSVGQMPLEVAELECDFLSATGRKFLRGPRGVGFLYVSDRALELGVEPLFPDMRGADWITADLYQPAPDARRFENWEFAYALLLGQGTAASYALQVGLEAIRDRAWHLADELRRRLSERPGVRVLDRGRIRCAIVTFSVEGRDVRKLSAKLESRGVNHTLSLREYAVIDFEEKGVAEAIRLSPHYYNTLNEIETAVSYIEELVTA